MVGLFFERPMWQEAPGLHALVIGISAYTHLPRKGERLQPRHFGMRQLASPALTAFRLAEWLVERADRFEVPLATCRLAVAPSDAELTAEPRLAGVAGRADFAAFGAHASRWREDACRDPAGMTLFYFAGHGLQRVKRDHVLVLQNFGDGVGASLSGKGINVNHLFDGMAPSAGQEQIARTQLYVFDACRVTPATFEEYEVMNVGAFWDMKKVPAEDNTARPTFFAARPGEMAFGEEANETLFGGALLKCLKGGAGVPLDETESDESDWIVSLHSLFSVLGKYIEEANRAAGANQHWVTQGLEGNFVIHRLDAPPDVDVSLELVPAEAAQYAQVSLVDADDNPLRTLPMPLEPHPHPQRVRAGMLRVLATIDRNDSALRRRRAKTYNIRPPAAWCRLPLSD